jgi:hypothetical protein
MRAMGLWFRLVLIAGLATAPLGCKSKKKDDSDDEAPAKKRTNKKDKKADDDDEDWDIPRPDPSKAPLPVLMSKPMGFERPTSLSYRWGKGASQFKRCRKAAKKKDWPAAQKSCEAAIAKDPRHLEARVLVARAMAQQKTTKGLADHLSTALAVDWARFGPELAADPLLAPYWKSPEGRALLKLNETYKTKFLTKAKAGILLLGRRGKQSKPSKPGKQWSSPRAEVFSYDLESKRYLRITQSKQSVAGFVVSSSGDELVYLGYNYVDWPKKAGDPVLIGAARVGVIDFETMTPKLDKQARVPGYYRRIELELAGGNEVVVSGYKADGSGLTPPFTYSLDRGAARLRRRNATAARAPGHLIVMYEAAWIERGNKRAGIKGSFPSRRFELADKKKSVELLEDEKTDAAGIYWAPNKAHLLVRTLAAPCEGKKEASLYLVAAADGKPRHVLRGASRWGARWIDNDRFVYEDPRGDLRVYDVAKDKQIERLHSYGGLGLDGVGGEPGPVCTAAVDPDKAGTQTAPDEDEDLE